MTFRPAVWYPISAVLGALNVGGAWFAARSAEPWHATIHAVLAVAFGLWAQRLRQARGTPALPAAVQELELEVTALRQELAEAQERLDFAERVLTEQRESRRVEPE